jgi:hypothetical protein
MAELQDVSFVKRWGCSSLFSRNFGPKMAFAMEFSIISDKSLQNGDKQN